LGRGEFTCGESVGKEFRGIHDWNRGRLVIDVDRVYEESDVVEEMSRERDKLISRYFQTTR
jgi:septum formation topological specificity factor MinE